MIYEAVFVLLRNTDNLLEKIFDIKKQINTCDILHSQTKNIMNKFE